MKFNLAFHNQFYAERKTLHDSPLCLCKKYQDGEEMNKHPIQQPEQVIYQQDKTEVMKLRGDGEEEAGRKLTQLF